MKELRDIVEGIHRDFNSCIVENRDLKNSIVNEIDELPEIDEVDLDENFIEILKNDANIETVNERFKDLLAKLTNIPNKYEGKELPKYAHYYMSDEQIKEKYFNEEENDDN